MEAPVSPASVPRLHVCLLATDGVGGEGFLAAVCGMAGNREIEIDGVPLQLNLNIYDAACVDDSAGCVGRSDAAALLIQHMDAPSLELLKGAYRLLPGENRQPTALMLLRESGRREFKMACPTCSQKLWVRDEDQGRVGRCPHCKKTFALPSQSTLVKSLLMLPASVPLVTVTLGNPASCRGPLASLVERARLRIQLAKSSTAPVQINPADPPAT